ncbi:MAG: hypothetical protein IH623_23650 [Verrucomicrobia bacterium]|nr:hypothetical protein [Verrucomicrobiota bacterium]
MNDERENFDSLQRLLKLKRYEQPPPRYFSDFSGQVLARINAGDPGGVVGGLQVASWLERLLSRFGDRPLVPAALGGGICALLMAGVVFMDTNPAPNNHSLWNLGIEPDNSATARPVSAFAANNSQLGEVIGSNSISNSLIPLEGSLFDRIPHFPPMRASEPFGSR